jgi:hypothetical protein
MRTSSFPLVIAALLCASPVAAQQQGRPERPYRGIFAGGVGDAEHLLKAEFSVSGGYDDNVLANASEGGAIGLPTDPRVAKSGGFGEANADLAYSLNRTRVGFGASLATTQRLYTTENGSSLGTYTGGASGWFELAKRTRLSVSASSAYQPFLSYSFFPVPVASEAELVEIVEPNFDLAFSRQSQWRHSIAASLTQGLSSRASLSFGGGYDLTAASDDRFDQKNYSGNGRFTLGISRGFGVHFGYGYQDARYSSEAQAGRSPVIHDLDIGVDFNRALSISRRTRLTFGTGSTAMKDRNQTVYRITGNARLSHEFRRTWNAALAYDRDAGFLQNLHEPTFSDSLAISVGGMATRRVQISTQLGAALGSVGVSSSNDYDSYFGSASATVALSRYVGVNVSYSNYRYSFDRSVELPVLTPRETNRQVVQGGMSLWLPLIHRSRRPNATR